MPSYVPAVAVGNRYGAATPTAPYRTPQVPMMPLSPRPLPPEEPRPPPCLTSGLPDPESVHRQKNAYSKGLDDQLKHGTDVLEQRLKQQSEYLSMMGAQQKRQYMLAVDQHIKQQEMLLAQQHTEQLLALQQSAQQRKSALEQQANALVLEYNQKRAQEELLQKQYKHAQDHYELQMKFQEELRQIQAQQEAIAIEASQPPPLPSAKAGGVRPPSVSSMSIASARGGYDGGSYVGVSSMGGASVVRAPGPRRASSYAPAVAPPPPPGRIATVQQSPTYYAPAQRPSSVCAPPTYGTAVGTYNQGLSTAASPFRGARVAPATSYGSLGGEVSYG